MKKITDVIRITILASVLFVLSPNLLTAQDTQKTSRQVLIQASQRAAKEGKNVFVIFEASWCVWCHRLDSIMNSKACQQLFSNSYVVSHLVVLESKARKHLETPGALELLAKYNGDKQGIPFWLILDKSGTLLADAQERAPGDGLDKPGRNTGCPATPSEIQHFIGVLKKTSLLSEADLAVIAKSFAEQ